MPTLRTPAQLRDAGLLQPERVAGLEQVAARYAVALPPALAGLIDRADRQDPIARQFVPSEAELDTQPQERADPIGDGAHSPVSGIVHRYPDRVLLKLTQICAVYCRFCFRREMVGPGKPGALDRAALAAALDYIREHREIWEVILTGGDPLVLSARRLREVMKALARHRACESDPHSHPRAGGRSGAGQRGTGARDEGQGQGNLRRRARQSCARIDGSGARRRRAHCRRRHSVTGPIGAARRRQRYARGDGRIDARLGRMPDQAILPAPRRSGARHRASAYAISRPGRR